MHRLSASLPRLRALAQAPRPSLPSLAIKSRLVSNTARPATGSSTKHHRTYATTSAPKESEGPSAESGGSRSKDAAAANSNNSDSTADPATAGIDTLAERSAKGQTGGGDPLESTSENAPPKPKISNASVPGNSGMDTLTEEQRREVEQHNRDFEKRHDRATPAEKDKVNKEFWSGGGTREEPGTK
ncbi:hypothetical protein GGTG_05313 [Gaeumannomyces tritici R3-111a-1]|uniref:Uncharacterized protein n=1 Tax=Gaeumannomyces tritici (strain R3-111a-1) TaxID=644352 RepID=J3NVJ8_GAET3|nr:hypothetical protein GGTG_05313 [Gaeumannomyces tritici R3-111a-1]EJT75376.1 hypothetical protein GGTG_05313 [Gaeumannomyces tritici R3-111a-1]